MTNIYIIWGDIGEYSERKVWTVCAYTEEALAWKHAKLLQAEANEAIQKYKNNAAWDVPPFYLPLDPTQERLPSDPYLWSLNYFVLPCELRDSFPVDEQ